VLDGDPAVIKMLLIQKIANSIRKLEIKEHLVGTAIPAGLYAVMHNLHMHDSVIMYLLKIGVSRINLENLNGSRQNLTGVCSSKSHLTC